MNYHSVEFIFFIAFLLFAFFITADKYKIYILIAANFIWYSSWGLTSLIALIFIVILNYLVLFLGKKSHWCKSQYFKSTLIGCNVIIFLILKSIHMWLPSAFQPVGLSFFMLMLIGLIFQYPTTSNRTVPTFSEFLFLPFFFPLLVGGPVEKSSHILPQLKKLSFNVENIVDGVLILSYGFSRRLLLALPLKKNLEPFFENTNLNWTQLLVLTFLSTFQFYLDFSSCCDIGRGAAKCFGINISINFRPFYFSKNPIDFWQRWNISISNWIRDTISIPLMLSYGKRISPFIFIFLSSLLMGLWHGLHINWLYFGIFNGLVLLGYSLFKNKFYLYPKMITIFGFILVIAMYVFNGLLQQSRFIELTQNSFSNVTRSFQSFAIDLADHLEFLLPWIVLFFIFEYYQERLNRVDFYLMTPQKIKYVIAAVLIVGFLALLHLNLILEYKSEVPLYFQI